MHEEADAISLTDECQTRLTALKVVGKSCGLAPGLVLREEEYEVVWEFEAVGAVGPPEFRWRLLGLEAEWSAPTFYPFVRYTNLRAGLYTFEVQSRYAGRPWGEPTRFAFQVISDYPSHVGALRRWIHESPTFEERFATHVLETTNNHLQAVNQQLHETNQRLQALTERFYGQTTVAALLRHPLIAGPLDHFARLYHRLEARLGYTFAHDAEAGAFFALVWLGLLLAFLVHCVVTGRFEQPLIAAAVVGLCCVLLPMGICLPNSRTPLRMRLAFLGTQWLLIMLATRIDHYAVTVYWLFGLIGQGAMMLRIAHSLLFGLLVLVGVSLRNLGIALTPDQMGSQMGLFVGGFFAWAAVLLMRGAAERRNEVAHLLTEIEGAHRVVREQAILSERRANEDSLTELFNRRFMDQTLPQVWKHARLSGQPLGLAFGDVDGFKEINDRFTHLVGDEVLKVIGRILRTQLRVSDRAVRYGGEEFALIFPETSLPNAVVACEKIRRAIEGYPWSTIHPSLRVTLSIGVADDSVATTSEGLKAAADAALFVAKRAGKNQVRFAEAHHQEVELAI